MRLLAPTAAELDLSLEQELGSKVDEDLSGLGKVAENLILVDLQQHIYITH